MRDVYGRPVFALSGAEYTWGDVVLAAALRGDWRVVVERARRGTRLLARDGQESECCLSDDEVESAANEFRYERDLITAEETEAWLARWDLDAETWMTWVGSDLLLRRPSNELPELEPAPEVSESAVHAEAVCSGALEQWAHRLAEEAAVAAGLRNEIGKGTAETTVEREPRLVPDLECLPFEPPRGGFGPRLLELTRLDHACRRLRESPVRPEDLEAHVRVRQIDWMRVRALVLSTHSEDAAREALVSIRDDGRAIEDVARDAGAKLRSEAFTLERVDSELRDRLLASRKGELLGPLAYGDGYGVLLVEEKVLPAATDPEIAAMAEASFRKSVATREVDARVSWRWKK